MIVSVDDLDGDGAEDLAVSAPWYRRDHEDRVGRMELRSARSGAVLAELFGDGADCWFGWHVRRTHDPDDLERPALLIGSLHHPADGKIGGGVIDLYVKQAFGGRVSGPAAEHQPSTHDPRIHGTTTREVRRNDIR